MAARPERYWLDMDRITLSNEADFQNGILNQYDPRIEVSFLISDVTRHLRALYDIEMGRLGLSRAQWRALIYVLRLESPTQTNLADALDIGRAATGSLIDHLEKNGFVARILDPDDRRVWRVVPTKAAYANVVPLNDAANKVAAHAFGTLSNSEILSLHDILVQIRDNLAE